MTTKYKLYSDRREKEIRDRLGEGFPITFRDIGFRTALEAQQAYDMRQIPFSVGEVYTKDENKIRNIIGLFYETGFNLTVINGRKLFERVRRNRRKQRIDGIRVA